MGGFFQAMLLAPAQQTCGKKLLETNFLFLLMTEKDGPRKDISLSDKKSTAETCAHLEEELQGLEGFEKAINK